MRWVNLPRSGQTSSRISSVIHPEGHKKPRATSEAQQASYVQLRSEVIIQQKLLSWVENLTKAHFTFTKKFYGTTQTFQGNIMPTVKHGSSVQGRPKEYAS